MLLTHQVKASDPGVKSSGYIGNGHGNGSEPGSVNGRGLAHRKLSYSERVALAADVATRVRRFEPSLGQLSSLFHVNVAAVRAEIKARAAVAANGNGEAKTLGDMACELVARLGLNAAFDLLV